MAKKAVNALQKGRAKRLDQLLDNLAGQGFTQQKIAAELGIPPNYLSDLRHARRAITDQFCHTFGQQFLISFQWLASGEGSKSSPQISPLKAAAIGNLVLPVLPKPYTGDPRHCQEWDGCQLEITGAAAAAAGRASSPYILRLASHDNAGRLKLGDLILISQSATGVSEIVILKHRNQLLLARKDKKNDWLTLSSGKHLSAKTDIVGQCLGIVWAGL